MSLVAVLSVVIAVSACRPSTSIPTPTPPPALRSVQATVRNATNAAGTLLTDDGEMIHCDVAMLPDGVPRLVCTLNPETPAPFGAHLTVTAPDRVELRIDFALDFSLGPTQNLSDLTLQPLHVDPSRIPLRELARIRGAMWPRASICTPPISLPRGPRPGAADNIIASVYLDNYTADERESIAPCLVAAGYTHVVVGALLDTDGYHGQYAGHDYTTPEGFEGFLDQLQWWWDHGLAPVVFIHPDGWTFPQTEAAVTPLLSSPRAQQLVRIVVMSGWEPTRYDWSSCTWAQYVALGRKLLPNALQLIHTVSDVDAPVGTDALCDDNGRPNGEGWQRVVSAGLSGWLIQNGPYQAGPTDDPAMAHSFGAQFQPDGAGKETHSVAWHFWNGIDHWPTGSIWGQGIPICLYAAEQTAYSAYWQGRPNDSARNGWGDLSLTSAGSVGCGYLDGGTQPVPGRR